jgi:hypothetical protein
VRLVAAAGGQRAARPRPFVQVCAHFPPAVRIVRLQPASDSRRPIHDEVLLDDEAESGLIL